MRTFESIYDELNKQQKKAVDTTEGPVMVIAGPGTGKTQILGARIAKIIHEGLSSPGNILCLTYTDAGAIAMKSRLVSMVGTVAYQVNIHTYHSFCNKVIQENYNYFGREELEPISDLEGILLFRKLIDSFDKEHVLKKWKNSAYFDIKRLKNLFETLKKENWTPEMVINSIDEELRIFKEDPKNVYKNATKDFKKGDFKIKDYEKLVATYESTRAAVNEYQQYEKLMQEAGRYTYEDMIQWVIKAFNEYPELLDKYQSNFNYILVDEYQDTNGSQNKIIEQLTSYWGTESNIFIVGDDDQSIYRFQGANVENIKLFFNKYLEPYSLEEKKDRVIVLTENYRSTQIILNTAKTLIEKNLERLILQFPQLQISKDLVAVGNNANGQNLVEIVEYDAMISESMGIGKHIINLIEQKVSPNDIAVIYRNHAQCDTLIKYLKNKHVYIKTKKTENILENVITNRLFDILTYLNDETVSGFSRQDLLVRILHFPFFKLAPRHIITFFHLYHRSRKERNYDSLRMYVNTKLHTFDDEGKSIAKVISILEKWIAEKEMITLQELFEKIINDTGLLTWVMQHEEKTAMLQELNALFSFVKDETHRQPKIYIKEFLDIVNIMIKEKLPVPWIKTNYIKEGVNFITAHSSKGLEFDYVFIIGNEENQWSSKGSSSNNFKLPTLLLHKVEDSNNEENRRLLYVAITRAKKALLMSYAIEADNQKSKIKSEFITEILDSEQGLNFQREKVNEAEQEHYLITTLQPTVKENPSIIEEAYLNELLENYSLSVTHLDKYLKCPLSFYYDNLLRVPIAKNDTMAYGDAVHKTLHTVFDMMKSNNKEFPNVEILLFEFEKKMNRQRESFTEKGFKEMVDYGKTMLPNYYKEKLTEWNKEVLLEESIKVFWKDISLNGKIDKVEFNGNSVKVVDYKTGKIANVNKFGSDEAPISEEALAQSIAEHKEIKDSEKFGGDYWRQAVFYKILIDNDPNRNWNVEEAIFEFMEVDKKTNKYPLIKIIVTPIHEQIVKEQILFTYTGIKNKQFDGCGKIDCEWCSFLSDKLKVEQRRY